MVVAHQQASAEQAQSTPLLRELYQCKRLLEEQAYETCSIEALVSRSPMSYATLRRYFKSTFRVFSQRVCVTPALTQSQSINPAFMQQSIAEIAQSVGFTDAYYFSRLFHAKTGASPPHFSAHNNESRAAMMKEADPETT